MQTTTFLYGGGLFDEAVGEVLVDESLEHP